jgi:hypothetical protein
MLEDLRDNMLLTYTDVVVTEDTIGAVQRSSNKKKVFT